jgi:hypothetical protein
MPASVVGGEILTKTARNCRPCSRSITQLPGSGRVFAGRNNWRVADQGDRFPLALHSQTKDAEAVLFVVVGDPFNEAGEAIELGGGSVGHGGEFSGYDRLRPHPSTGVPCGADDRRLFRIVVAVATITSSSSQAGRW